MTPAPDEWRPAIFNWKVVKTMAYGYEPGDYRVTCRDICCTWILFAFLLILLSFA